LHCDKPLQISWNVFSFHTAVDFYFHYPYSKTCKSLSVMFKLNSWHKFVTFNIYDRKTVNIWNRSISFGHKSRSTEQKEPIGAMYANSQCIHTHTRTRADTQKVQSSSLLFALNNNKKQQRHSQITRSRIYCTVIWNWTHRQPDGTFHAVVQNPFLRNDAKANCFITAHELNRKIADQHVQEHYAQWGAISQIHYKHTS